MLAEALMTASSQFKVESRVLDLDALYSSNADVVLGKIPPSARNSILLDVPEPGAAIGAHVQGLFDARRRMVIVDSLNTMHHLFSRSGRSLSFIVSAFSVFSKANGLAVIMTKYNRLGATGPGRKGSVSELPDLEFSVRIAGEDLVLECTRGQAWAENAVVVRAT